MVIVDGDDDDDDDDELFFFLLLLFLPTRRCVACVCCESDLYRGVYQKIRFFYLSFSYFLPLYLFFFFLSFVSVPEFRPS